MLLVTYIFLYSGSYAIPDGRPPTLIGLPVTVFVVVSITKTLSLLLLVTLPAPTTYMLLFAGSYANFNGKLFNIGGIITVCASTFIIKNENVALNVPTNSTITKNNAQSFVVSFT